MDSFPSKLSKYGIECTWRKHKEEERLFLHFKYDADLVEKIKHVPGRRWSNTYKCWHVLDSDLNRRILLLILPAKNNSNLEWEIVAECFADYILKTGFNYAIARSYLVGFQIFASYFYEVKPTSITKKQLTSFLLIVNNQKLDIQTIQIFESVILFYEQILKLDVLGNGFLAITQEVKFDCY